METTESKPAGRLQRLQAYRQEHAKAEIAAFFAAGCLFDIVTLSRIDNVANLVQLGLYLVVLAWLMLLDERYSAGVGSPPRWLRGAWRFSEDVIHFLLGSLLSVFTLFYLKSTSGVASFVFLALLGTLLVANELPGFREHGPIVRFGLLGLTLTTYLLLLLPILFGFLSVWLFVAAIILSSAAIGWLARTLVRWTGDLPAALRRLAAPALGVQALLILANVGGLIPPAPLSVQYVGIYHEVVPPGAQEAPADDSPANASIVPGAPATGAPAPRGTYALKHERPWWKVWHHGDQDFAARPGDVIYCFARVFAPNGFRDAIYVHWWLRSEKGKWLDQGRTQLSIKGGRDNGFRAFATKQNYQPGRWRVEIETGDGRDLGVIGFDLVNDLGTETREFLVDRQ